MMDLLSSFLSYCLGGETVWRFQIQSLSKGLNNLKGLTLMSTSQTHHKKKKINPALKMHTVLINLVKSRGSQKSKMKVDMGEKAGSEIPVMQGASHFRFRSKDHFMSHCDSCQK